MFSLERWFRDKPYLISTRELGAGPDTAPPAEATAATLEVRRSNTVAQSLYSKFRFEVVGERRRYYERREDALIMTAGPLDAAYRVFLKEKQTALFERLQGERPNARLVV